MISSQELRDREETIHGTKLANKYQQASTSFPFLRREILALLTPNSSVGYCKDVPDRPSSEGNSAKVGKIEDSGFRTVGAGRGYGSGLQPDGFRVYVNAVDQKAHWIRPNLDCTCHAIESEIAEQLENFGQRGRLIFTDCARLRSLGGQLAIRRPAVAR